MSARMGTAPPSEGATRARAADRARYDAIRGRALRACACVFALVALVPVVEGVFQATRPGVLREVADASLWDAGDAEFARRAFEGGEEGGSAEAPPAFEEEALSLAGRCDVRVDERAGVVGFVVEESQAEAFSAVRSELESKGWTGVRSGDEACGTFAKGHGSYRWAFASCVRAGAATCVVVQVVPVDEEGA